MSKLVAEIEERLVAAVDLGSNSFHMTVAKITHSGIQILSRDRERVRLASGLNNKGVLDKKAIAKGIDALVRFDSRLTGVTAENIRVVATHALREAKNADEFLDLASSRFRAPIEVISGPEEARLIYQAVAHTQPIEGRFLVFDVGGGSTEFAVGEGYEPAFVSSRTLGCVTYTDRYMKKINKKAFAEVDIATRRAIEPIASRIRSMSALTCFASSGSAKGVSALGNYLGFGPVITRESIEACKRFVAKEDNRRLENIPDVSIDRMQFLPAGIGIISAILDELRIKEIHFADAALREGVLYDMDDRLKAVDIRERTASDLVKKYGIEKTQAQAVRSAVEQLFDAVADPWKLSVEDKQMVLWAASLHEIGLQVNYSAYQRHGAYIVSHTTMPGFNREQQLVLSILIRLHRKKITVGSIPKLRYWSESRLIRLVRLLRIAYTIHVGRNNYHPEFTITVDDDAIFLQFAPRVLKTHPVMFLDLAEEARRQDEAGYSLIIQ